VVWKSREGAESIRLARDSERVWGQRRGLSVLYNGETIEAKKGE
jgi:hypothetical protein